MTEMEHLFECVAMKGECPDCNRHTLERKGSYLRCRICQSAFFADHLLVTRVKFSETRHPSHNGAER